MEEGAKTTLRRIFASDGEDEDEEEEDEEEDEENGDGDRRRSDPPGAGGPHSVIQQQRGKRGSSTVDDSSITCSCGREYEHEKAGTYMQRVVDADMASLAARRRELGDAFDPCGLLIESDFQPGQVGYDVQTVIRMLVQAAPALSEDTEPMRSEYQTIRCKADAMVYSFLEACLYQRNPRGRYALTHFPKRVCVALMEMGVKNEVLDLLNTLRVSVGSRAGFAAMEEISANHVKNLQLDQLEEDDGLVFQTDNHEQMHWHTTFNGSVAFTIPNQPIELDDPAGEEGDATAREGGNAADGIEGGNAAEGIEGGKAAEGIEGGTAGSMLRSEWINDFNVNKRHVTCGCQVNGCIDGRCACIRSEVRCGEACKCKCCPRGDEGGQNAVGSFIDSCAGIKAKMADDEMKRKFNPRLMHRGKDIKAKPYECIAVLQRGIGKARDRSGVVYTAESMKPRKAVTELTGADGTLEGSRVDLVLAHKAVVISWQAEVKTLVDPFRKVCDGPVVLVNEDKQKMKKTRLLALLKQYQPAVQCPDEEPSDVGSAVWLEVLRDMGGYRTEKSLVNGSALFNRILELDRNLGNPVFLERQKLGFAACKNLWYPRAKIKPPSCWEDFCSRQVKDRIRKKVLRPLYEKHPVDHDFGNFQTSDPFRLLEALLSHPVVMAQLQDRPNGAQAIMSAHAMATRLTVMVSQMPAGSMDNTVEKGFTEHGASILSVCENLIPLWTDDCLLGSQGSGILPVSPDGIAARDGAAVLLAYEDATTTLRESIEELEKDVKPWLPEADALEAAKESMGGSGEDEGVTDASFVRDAMRQFMSLQNWVQGRLVVWAAFILDGKEKDRVKLAKTEKPQTALTQLVGEAFPGTASDHRNCASVENGFVNMAYNDTPDDPPDDPLQEGDDSPGQGEATQRGKHTVSSSACVPYATRADGVKMVSRKTTEWSVAYGASHLLDGKYLPIPSLDDDVGWQELSVEDVAYHLEHHDDAKISGDEVDCLSRLRGMVRSRTITPTSAHDERFATWNTAPSSQSAAREGSQVDDIGTGGHAAESGVGGPPPPLPPPRIFIDRSRLEQEILKELQEASACTTTEQGGEQPALGRLCLYIADLGISQHTNERQASGDCLELNLVPALLHLLFKTMECLDKKYCDDLKLMKLFTDGLNVKVDSGEEAYLKVPTKDLVKMMDAYSKAADAVLIALHRSMAVEIEASGVAGSEVPALSLKSGSPFHAWIMKTIEDEGPCSRTWAWLEFCYDTRMVLTLHTAGRAMSWHRLLMAVYEVGPLLMTTSGPYKYKAEYVSILARIAMMPLRVFHMYVARGLFWQFEVDGSFDHTADPVEGTAENEGAVINDESLETVNGVFSKLGINSMKKYIRVTGAFNAVRAIKADVAYQLGMDTRAKRIPSRRLLKLRERDGTLAIAQVIHKGRANLLTGTLSKRNSVALRTYVQGTALIVAGLQERRTHCKPEVKHRAYATDGATLEKLRLFDTERAKNDEVARQQHVEATAARNDLREASRKSVEARRIELAGETEANAAAYAKMEGRRAAAITAATATPPSYCSCDGAVEGAVLPCGTIACMMHPGTSDTIAGMSCPTSQFCFRPFQQSLGVTHPGCCGRLIHTTLACSGYTPDHHRLRAYTEECLVKDATEEPAHRSLFVCGDCREDLLRVEVHIDTLEAVQVPSVPYKWEEYRLREEAFHRDNQRLLRRLAEKPPKATKRQKSGTGDVWKGNGNGSKKHSRGAPGTTTPPDSPVHWPAKQPRLAERADILRAVVEATTEMEARAAIHGICDWLTHNRGMVINRLIERSQAESGEEKSKYFPSSTRSRQQVMERDPEDQGNLIPTGRVQDIPSDLDTMYCPKHKSLDMEGSVIGVLFEITRIIVEGNREGIPELEWLSGDHIYSAAPHMADIADDNQPLNPPSNNVGTRKFKRLLTSEIKTVLESKGSVAIAVHHPRCSLVSKHFPHGMPAHWTLLHLHAEKSYHLDSYYTGNDDSMLRHQRAVALLDAIQDQDQEVQIGHPVHINTTMQVSGNACAFYTFISNCFCLFNGDGITAVPFSSREGRKRPDIAWSPSVMGYARPRLREALDQLQPPRCVEIHPGKATQKGVTTDTDKVTLKFVVPTKECGIVNLSLDDIDVPFEATIPMAMEPGVPTLGAYNAGFYTSVAFVIPEGVSSGIHSFRAAVDLQETQGKKTRVTLRGCQTITICTE